MLCLSKQDWHSVRQHCKSGGSLTDEGGDDVVHAFQEAGQVLRGRVMRRRDLRHHRRCLSPRRLRAAVVRQDVRQAQDAVHLVGAKHRLNCNFSAYYYQNMC